MTYKEYENPEELRTLQLISVDLLKEFDRVCEILDIPYFLYSGTALGAVRHKGFIPWDDDIDLGMLRKDYDRFLSEAPKVVGDDYEVVNALSAPHFPACNANLSLRGTYCVPEEFANCPYQYAIGLGLYAFDYVVDDEKLFRRQCRRTWFWGRLSFLRATPKPHLSLRGWKRVLASAACYAAHGCMKLIHLSPQWIYMKWEKAATQYNDRGGDLVADFADRDPLTWSARIDELFPTKRVEFEGLILPTAREDDAMLTREYGDYMQLPPLDDRKNHYPSRLDFGNR